MKKINFNKFAAKVCELEGGSEQVNIAQTKQVLTVALEILMSDYPMYQVVELLERYKPFPSV